MWIYLIVGAVIGYLIAKGEVIWRLHHLSPEQKSVMLRHIEKRDL